jgi:hypothetical protein
LRNAVVQRARGLFGFAIDPFLRVVGTLCLFFLCAGIVTGGGKRWRGRGAHDAIGGTIGGVLERVGRFADLELRLDARLWPFFRRRGTAGLR